MQQQQEGSRTRLRECHFFSIILDLTDCYPALFVARGNGMVIVITHNAMPISMGPKTWWLQYYTDNSRIGTSVLCALISA